jgi:Flp pilus assembly protein TadG
MSCIPTLLARLRADTGGAMIIETAVVAPVLVLMSLGAFQISSLVARQSELDSAAAEGAAIAIASPPTTSAKKTTLQQVIATSLAPAAPATNNVVVTITDAYRCNSSTAYVTTSTTCPSGGVISNYVRIVITDSYTPIWTEFGVGSAISYRVSRYVQYSQANVP